MEIAQLEAFVRIVTEGSITRAGIALQRNQSSISMRLAALEHSLGTMLFERSGRRLVLTAAGRAFLPYAEKILELRAESERETQFAARSVSRMPATDEVLTMAPPPIIAGMA